MMDVGCWKILKTNTNFTNHHELKVEIPNGMTKSRTKLNTENRTLTTF